MTVAFALICNSYILVKQYDKNEQKKRHAQSHMLTSRDSERPKYNDVTQLFGLCIFMQDIYCTIGASAKLHHIINVIKSLLISVMLLQNAAWTSYSLGNRCSEHMIISTMLMKVRSGYVCSCHLKQLWVTVQSDEMLVVRFILAFATLNGE